MIFSMKGLLCRFTAPNHLFRNSRKIQVTGCCYRQTHVCVAATRPFVYRVPLFGGSKNYFIAWNKKALFKGIYTLNGIHLCVFINTESLNARATHFK